MDKALSRRAFLGIAGASAGVMVASCVSMPSSDMSQGPPVLPNTITPTFNAQGGANRPKGTPLAASLTSGECNVGLADDSPGAFVVGLAVGRAVDGERVTTQFAGPFAMTAAEWDTILGNTLPAGLTPGAQYFLSESHAGRLTEVAPGAGYVNQIGVALTETIMLIQISGARFVP